MKKIHFGSFFFLKGTVVIVCYMKAGIMLTLRGITEREFDISLKLFGRKSWKGFFLVFLIHSLQSYSYVLMKNQNFCTQQNLFTCKEPPPNYPSPHINNWWKSKKNILKNQILSKIPNEKLLFGLIFSFSLRKLATDNNKSFINSK